MTRNLAKVASLARKLIGTTGDTEVLDEVNDLSREESRALDALAFKCVKCDWWFAAHERKTVNDEWMCDGCADEVLHP